MLHIVYILAFTIIAFLAIFNLIRSLITLSTDSQRHYASGKPPLNRKNVSNKRTVSNTGVRPHPELFDSQGKPIKEPLLVMRSVSVEDARQQLDNIYNASPSQPREIDE